MTLGDLTPVIAATTRWLVRAYPAEGGVFHATLAEVQARQAVTVAAWLRYPTTVDAALLGLTGPGGSARLDWIAETGAGTDANEADEAWRTWVDEVVASWAACLLADPVLAADAVAEIADCEHTAGLHCEFRRLTSPDARDRHSSVLMRHPDLLAPIADLHRAQLLDRLTARAA